jgi:hypothetical protein
VICRPIDKRNLSFGFGLLLGQLPYRADGAPKSCETTTQNENVLIRFAPKHLVPDSTLSDDRWSQRLINTKVMRGRRHTDEQ